MNIKEFLLARIAEDEELARAAIQPEEMHPYGDAGIPAMAVDEWPDAVRGYLGGPWGEHAANSNPTRILAECAAKQAIIEFADRVETMDYQITSEWGGDLDGAGDDILKAFAAVYSDHPDYQKDWKP